MTLPNFRAARGWHEQRDREARPGRALSRRVMERPLDLQEAAHEHTLDELHRMEIRLQVLHERAVLLGMRLSAEALGRAIDIVRVSQRAYELEVPAQGTRQHRAIVARDQP